MATAVGFFFVDLSSVVIGAYYGIFDARSYACFAFSNWPNAVYASPASRCASDIWRSMAGYSRVVSNRRLIAE